MLSVHLIGYVIYRNDQRLYIHSGETLSYPCGLKGGDDRWASTTNCEHVSEFETGRLLPCKTTEPSTAVKDWLFQRPIEIIHQQDLILEQHGIKMVS